MTASPPQQCISIRYVYSACIVTITPDVRILHDPWFTEGAYDGAWFQHPKVQDPIGSIGDVDLIYISHLHPDHYDSAFLKKYFAAYGVKEVVIANHAVNHLENKMRADGIKATVLQAPLRIGSTEIDIYPQETGSASAIDSAIVLSYTANGRRHCVVNANDIIFDEPTMSALKTRAGNVDILLCGYTGAGPYPQTYLDLDDPRMPVEAEKKRQAFFDRYKRLVKTMGAKVNLPFAGKYMLGGRLTDLNPFRGVADPTAVLAFDECAIVLADNGGQISTSDFKPSAIRTQPYDPADVRKREAEIRPLLMDYERLLSAQEIHQLPLKRLLMAAARRAKERSECETDYYFVFHLPNREVAIVNANRNAERPVSFGSESDACPEPRSEITIDPRYLFGLLTHVYHWNNAEVGSQYQTRRTPDLLHRPAQAYLNFLAL